MAVAIFGQMVISLQGIARLLCLYQLTGQDADVNISCLVIISVLVVASIRPIATASLLWLI